jgi:hypothetical protein
VDLDATIDRGPDHIGKCPLVLRPTFLLYLLENMHSEHRYKNVSVPKYAPPLSQAM